jgi:hypothetical protein
LATAAWGNTYLRDNFAAAFPTDAVWTTWAPTYANLTVGSGTVVARYIQVGDLVTARYSIVFAGDSAMGTAPTVSMPVTAISANSNTPLGLLRIEDAATANFVGHVNQASTTTFGTQVHSASGTYVGPLGITSTVPMTWTTSDVLAFEAIYEAA